MRARARVIAIGSELLGDKRDTNGPELCRRLAARGFDVQSLAAVPDDIDEIVAVLSAALPVTELIVVLGGLGPTDDDLTREAVTAATGVTYLEDDATMARIESFMTRRGRPVSAASRRQALVAAGGAVIANPVGLAAGSVIESSSGGAVLALLPGPPRELEAMVEDALARATSLLSTTGRAPSAPRHAVTLVLCGLGESEAFERVRGVEALSGLGVAWLASSGEVRLILRGDDMERVRATAGACADVLGANVVSRDGRSLPQVIVEMLAQRGETVATAESCTGGLVAASLTGVPGSSAVFQRGFVTYSDDAKCELLGVPRETLARHGAVSESVVRAMASGARRAGQADWGVAVTGIAGPGGGSEAKPVGLVWIGVSLPDGRVVVRESHFGGTREDIRLRSAATALDMLRREAIGEHG